MECGGLCVIAIGEDQMLKWCADNLDILVQVNYALNVGVYLRMISLLNNREGNTGKCSLRGWQYRLAHTVMAYRS